MGLRVRFPLFTKILFWLSLNLLLLGAVLVVFFNLQFRFAPDSPLFAAFSTRLDSVARLIADEMRSAAESERSAILLRYSNSYKVDFLLYADSGNKLAGKDLPVPAEVVRHLAQGPPPPGPAGSKRPRWRGPGDDQNRPPWSGPRAETGPRQDFPGRPQGARPATAPMEQASSAPPRPYPMFTLKTSNPTRYWAGVRLIDLSTPRSGPSRATLLAVSDSMFGHGLFLDPTPWLLVTAIALALSILLWIPFVRGLTVTVKQMTTATEHIAEERFDARVSEKRSDELGRLGAAINQLAIRLESFVSGQKRFLGDISHELNSPLARMQFALGILEERVGPAQKEHVADAQEEVQLMSQLVSELLAFAKAGMRTSDLKLVSVPLLPLVQQVCAREAAACDVHVDIPDGTAVLAQPPLLSRALANVLRNAARYAPGVLEIAAHRDHDQVRITVADHGPGVPPDTIPLLFEPFYRIEPDRARATGGTGLGLAIVKTCVEACRGSVAARNLSPSGLEISIVLQAGDDLISSVPEGIISEQ